MTKPSALWFSFAILLTTCVVNQAFAQQTTIKEIWPAQRIQNELSVTSFETEDMRVFSVPTPDHTQPAFHRGDAVVIEEPATEDDGVARVCIENTPGIFTCNDDISDLYSQFTSELHVNRVLHGDDPRITVLELSNLRLFAFENYNQVLFSPGDPVSLYDNDRGDVYICITGEHTLCADELPLNEDSPFVPVETPTHAL